MTCRNWSDAIGPHDRAAIEQLRSSMIALHAKQDLVHGDSDCEKLYLVLKGWFGRYREGTGGGRQTLSLIFPGEFLNPEIVYLPNSGTGFTALTRGRVLAIDREAAQELLRSRPSIADLFGRLLAQDNALLEEEATRLGRRTARERMAHFICETVYRLERIERPSHRGFHCALTQEQLADVLGLTVVHVNRTMRDLRAMNLIEWRSQRLKVIDWPGLVRIARFDASYLQVEQKAGALPKVELKIAVGV
ncbi:MAG: Crp/Fnr family transcriptional regulator [Pseudomonadota bacterium]|nr:Crp/Fnr family transcriptional regulator [Pseudomonadota bacterium]